MPPQIPLEVAPGYKFAVLAVPETRGGGVPGGVLLLPNGFAASSSLPAGALETWKADIGRFHAEELARCSLFLWALMPSATPDILDHENRELARRTHYLLLGLLLAVPYFSAGRITELTGANADGVARARSFTTYDRTHWTLGAPVPDFSAGKYRLAEQLAMSLFKHDQSRGRWRIERALRALREACESSRVDERIHQYVRCAEAFADPFTAPQFAERLSRMCVGHSKHDLGQMYRIRSGIEHLYGPFDRMPKRLSSLRKHWLLLQRTVQAEALSRYLLVTYLSNETAWPHFADRTSTKSFWALTPAKLRAVWPTRIGFGAILDAFDVGDVRRHEREFTL